MQKNELVILQIEEINNLGCGVAHLSLPGGARGQAVFVHGAVTGDEVEARIIKVNASYLVAKTERILTPSPIRTENFCRAAGCGGCIYSCVGYAHELEMKQEYVRNAFRKAGLPAVQVESVLSTGKTTRYRNKAQYPVANGKNGMQAGFFAAASHRLVPMDDCPLQPEVFSGIVREICRFCDRNGIRAYEETTGKGLLRHIYLRRGAATGEIGVCLVLNGDRFPEEQALAGELTKAFPEVTGITVNINRKNTNVILGERFRTIWGNPWIEDVLCGKHFRISPGAFYQVNHDACELLYRLAAERAELKEGGILLDLYCGIGTIGLCIAPDAEKIIGLEIVDEAVQRAAENAERNGMKNAFFYCGDASDLRALLEKAEKEHGSLRGATVVMDPPRKGSTPEAIDFLAESGFHRIVYISCNPDTLARDCARFQTHGYRIGTATPVDLFPHTGHVETVLLLSREEEDQKAHA